MRYMLSFCLALLLVLPVRAQRTPLWVNGVVVNNGNLKNGSTVTFGVSGSNITATATTPGVAGTVINAGASALNAVPTYSDTTGTNVAPSTVTITSGALSAPGALISGTSTTNNAGQLQLAVTNQAYHLTLTPGLTQAAAVRMFVQDGAGLWFSTVSTTNETVSRYTTSGSGTVVALATNPTIVTPTIASYTSPPFTALVDGATITATADVTKSRQNFTVTLGGNRTLAFSGMAAGMEGNLIVRQDGTGSRTLVLPATSKVISGGSGAVTLTTTASAIDILSFVYDGSNYFWTIGKNFN